MTAILQIIMSLLGIGVVVLLVLIGLAWRSGGQREKIENRLDALDIYIGALQLQIVSMVGLLSCTIMSLHRSQAITDQEYYDSVGEFTNLLSGGAEPMVDRLTRDMNPLTVDEVRRFKELVDKARNGVFFTRPEVEEYKELIRKVQAEHPDEPRIWPLVALGAFLSGLYVGQPRVDE